MNRALAGMVLGVLGLMGTPTRAQMVDSHAPTLEVPAESANVPKMNTAKPVARVNGAVLTETDLLNEIYTIFPYSKQHSGGIPKAMEADIRRGALKMIEFEELVYQEAKRRGMTISPERLAKAEKALRKQLGTQQQYKEFVQVEGNGSDQVIRTKIKRSLLIEDLLKIEVTDKSVVTLAESKAFCEKNPEKFKLPETYALQTITIMPPVRPSPQQPTAPPPTPEQWKEMKVRADAALRQAKAAKNYEEFGVLAEKISEDDYRVMMGNHKAVDAKNLPPEVLQAASKLQVGQVSDLIQAEGAYTIIRLNAHNPARMQSFDESSKSLQALMRQQKTERLRRELDAKLRKNAKIEEL
jgi:parvulin-like peptidyl-prolyl isomerase